MFWHFALEQFRQEYGCGYTVAFYYSNLTGF